MNNNLSGHDPGNVISILERKCTLRNARRLRTSDLQRDYDFIIFHSIAMGWRNQELGTMFKVSGERYNKNPRGNCFHTVSGR